MRDWITAWKIHAGFDWLLPPLIPAFMLWSLVYRAGGATAEAVYTTFELYVPLVAAFLFGGIAAAGHQAGLGELEASFPASGVRRLSRALLAAALCLAAVLGLLAFIGRLITPDAEVQQMLRAAAVPTLVLGALALAASAATRSGLAGVGLALLYWGADATTSFEALPWLHLFRYTVPLAGQAGEGWLVAGAVVLAGTGLVLVNRRSWWVR